MKKRYILKYIFLLPVLTALFSCDPDKPVEYSEIPKTSPVVLDFNADPFPYAKLSEYKFFEGGMKDMKPAYKVLTYDLNSTLFTDYAHKKRFIWMPEGVEATYTADGKVLEFPSGTVLIKNFYYDHVQPSDKTKIIETRLMIRKNNDWIFADYVWNEEQTEAYLDLNGSYVPISWTDGSETRSTTYRIPSEVECYTCHKLGNRSIPIGPKPQNLNKPYNYPEGFENQLTKWQKEGYLSSNLPQNITSTVDWTNETQPLELRVRSYIDVNCAHCHQQGSHCDYRPMRFAFSETATPVNLGVCVVPHEVINPSLAYIITKKNSARSVLSYRIKSVNPAERMPLLGRTMVHEEAVAMIEQWINSMDQPCP